MPKPRCRTDTACFTLCTQQRNGRMFLHVQPSPVLASCAALPLPPVTDPLPRLVLIQDAILPHVVWVDSCGSPCYFLGDEGGAT